jgi:hypothetical protein
MYPEGKKNGKGCMRYVSDAESDVSRARQRLLYFHRVGRDQEHKTGNLQKTYAHAADI